MSPTLLARLRAAEREVQRWSRAEHAHWTHKGMPASARWYSERRSVWPDALTLVAQGLL
jgi:hypothetical protein